MLITVATKHELKITAFNCLSLPDLLPLALQFSSFFPSHPPFYLKISPMFYDRLFLNWLSDLVIFQYVYLLPLNINCLLNPNVHENGELFDYPSMSPPDVLWRSLIIWHCLCHHLLFRLSKVCLLPKHPGQRENLLIWCSYLPASKITIHIISIIILKRQSYVEKSCVRMNK